MSSPGKRIYKFGQFTLNANERRLEREGEEIYLQPKTFETLAFLVERHGRLVKKSDLMDSLWPDAFVTENALSRCIKEVRETLQDDAFDPRYIKTLPRVGYKFIAEVEEIEGAEPGDEAEKVAALKAAVISKFEDETPGVKENAAALPEQSIIALPTSQESARRALRTSLPAIVAALALAGAVLVAINFWPRREARLSTTKSIAVLPFKPLVASSRDETLEMGMAETLINKLTTLKKLKVLPISAVRKYSGLEQDALSAGREQRADAVLDGSIQKSAGRIRVNVRLVQVSDGEPLLVEELNERWTDMFAVQDSIAEKVAEKLMAQLTGAETEGLKKRYTEHIGAYELYIKGRICFFQYSKEGGEKAYEYFNQAIALDPDFALAHAGIADLFSLASGVFYPPTDVRPLAKKSVMRALELDDKLPEVQLSLAWVKWWGEWDFPEAEKVFLRAIDLNPNFSLAHQEYGRFLVEQQRFDEAIREMKLALDNEPVSELVNFEFGSVLYYSRQYDRAIEQLRETIKLHPNSPPAHARLGLVYAKKGMYEQALVEVRKAMELKDHYIYQSYLGYVYALSGRRGEALKVIDELKSLSKKSYVSPYSIAMIYAGLGEKEPTISWLEKAYEDHSDQLLRLRVDPALDTVRSDPRVADLLGRIGLIE